MTTVTPWSRPPTQGYLKTHDRVAQLGERALDRERRPYCPLRVMLPFSDSRAFLTSWTIWTDHFGDKDFLFALVLPSVFFFVAIGRSKIGDAQ
jgi:hypothetical protein